MAKITTLRDTQLENEILITIREDTGYNMEEVAAELDIDKSTLWSREHHWEYHKSSIPAPIMRKWKQSLLNLCVTRKKALDRHILWLENELKEGVKSEQ